LITQRYLEISVLPKSTRFIVFELLQEKEALMKKLIASAVIALALVPSGALAQERTADAALGALSGAVVLGPLGAVAGAVVGYTAGPAIANSWGLRRSSRHYHRHSARSAKGPVRSADDRANIQ
jgi:hypothetical protein